jgi:hypothetical protein
VRTVAPFLAPLAALSVAGCASLSGWMAPADTLTFPERPVASDATGRAYDVDGNGVADFAIRRGPSGRYERLEYDDDEDGRSDRTFTLGQRHPAGVPHLILLVDSLPYRILKERWLNGHWGWFHRPSKVIPPFPSLSEVTFGEILHAPPLGANIERYYDRRIGEVRNLWIDRALGYEHPWQQRLDSRLSSYLDVGMSYVTPRPWYRAELSAAKAAVDAATGMVTIAYVVSSSAMLSRYGVEGLDECLARLDQLCMQLLWERQGAIDISILSDHGHNLAPSPNVPVARHLADAGFNPVDTIVDRRRDVVAEIDGLVTYFGVHTSRPIDVADAMLALPEVQLAFYQAGDVVVVRDREGVAHIDRDGDQLRYRPLVGDPLRLAGTVLSLRANGGLDDRGFGADRAWFDATVDLEYPDALHRVWHAFHGQVINTPQVMFTLHDGFCAGLAAMDDWIDMQSTHGGLNQVNSDAVLLTTTGEVVPHLRSREVLRLIEPRIAARLDR